MATILFSQRTFCGFNSLLLSVCQTHKTIQINSSGIQQGRLGASRPWIHPLLKKINTTKKQSAESGAEAFNCHQAPTVTICELSQLLFIYVNFCFAFFFWPDMASLFVAKLRQRRSWNFGPPFCSWKCNFDERKNKLKLFWQLAQHRFRNCHGKIFERQFAVAHGPINWAANREPQGMANFVHLARTIWELFWESNSQHFYYVFGETISWTFKIFY